MALPIYDELKPMGDFTLVNAKDVRMPDGRRLSEWEGGGASVPEILPGVAEIEPEKHYVFGAVSSLAVTLAQLDDGKAHEYWFEFQPEEGFSGLTITPEVKWANEPQYPAGKTCLVGIYMGMAVMAIA